VSENQFVTADAQFGNAKILRPFPTWQAVYQGVNANRPLLFAEDGRIHDSQAGKPGYSPWLMSGLSVPLGARVVLWLPKVSYTVVAQANAQFPYSWKIAWRMRNLYDFRTNRIPYHIPSQSLGDASTLAGDTGDRVVLIAAAETVPYVGAEPVLNPLINAIPSNVDLRNAAVNTELPNNSWYHLPIDENGNRLTYSQGVFDPGAPPVGYQSQSVRSVAFQIYETQAVGDEMIIVLERDNSVVTDWDFTVAQADYILAQIIGSSANIGVYAFIGSAP